MKTGWMENETDILARFVEDPATGALIGQVEVPWGVPEETALRVLGAVWTVAQGRHSSLTGRPMPPVYRAVFDLEAFCFAWTIHPDRPDEEIIPLGGTRVEGT